MEEQHNLTTPRQDSAADWISLIIVIVGMIFLTWVIGERILSMIDVKRLMAWLGIWFVVMLMCLKLLSSIVERLSTQLDIQGVRQYSLIGRKGRKNILWKDVTQIRRARAFVWTITITDSVQSISVVMTQFRDPHLVAAWIRKLTTQLNNDTADN